MRSKRAARALATGKMPLTSLEEEVMALFRALAIQQPYRRAMDSSEVCAHLCARRPTDVRLALWSLTRSATTVVKGETLRREPLLVASASRHRTWFRMRDAAR